MSDDEGVSTRSQGEATLVATDAGDFEGPERPPLQRGDVVGRYVVLDVLGAGGMGVVYAGFDPELDRKVALKLLRYGSAGAWETTGRARLMREAQAMAKLAAPNVVTVHDVGEHEGAVWIAMEFVEGRTLRQWRKEEGPSWSETAAVFRKAGAGLAAAHAKGLVHRDFKPDNVMVANDGRVLVMDFGLARAEEQDESQPSPANGASEVLDSHGSESHEITAVGAVIGTPAYMAPEQHMGLATDHRTDQFSFCVALWESLYGQRPYRGDTLPALAVSVTSGQRVPPPARSEVPSWLRRVLERGMAVLAEERWPGMQALLDELGRGEQRARSRRVAVAAGVGLATALAAFGGWRFDVAQRVEGCTAEAESIDRLWDDESRERLRTAIALAPAAGAAETADRTVELFDAYAKAWSTERDETCTAHQVEATLDPGLAEARYGCLDERRDDFAALIDVLSDVDPAMVPRAIPAAVSLDPITTCRDAVARRSAPTDNADPDAVRQVRSGLARARALERAGRDLEAHAVAEEAAVIAAGLDHEALRVRAIGIAAALQAHNGEFDEGADRLERAFIDALRIGDDVAAARIAMKQAWVVGVLLRDDEHGVFWGHTSLTLLERAERTSGLEYAEALNNLGGVLFKQRSLDAAYERHEQALELRRQVLGERHPEVAASLNNLGAVWWARGELDKAEAVHMESLTITEEAFGPEHPDVGTAVFNLGTIQFMRGELDAALESYRHSIELRERAIGPEHPELAVNLNNLGALHEKRGELREAEQAHRRALAIREKTLEPDHPSIAGSLNNLGMVLYEQDRLDEARELHERALAIRGEAEGERHPDVAGSLDSLGILELKAGNHARALELLERAIEIFDEHEGDQQGEAEARFGLARALLIVNGERERAAQLAQASAAGYRRAGDEDSATKVDLWLREQMK